MKEIILSILRIIPFTYTKTLHMQIVEMKRGVIKKTFIPRSANDAVDRDKVRKSDEMDAVVIFTGHSSETENIEVAFLLLLLISFCGQFVLYA